MTKFLPGTNGVKHGMPTLPAPIQGPPTFHKTPRFQSTFTAI